METQMGSKFFWEAPEFHVATKAFVASVEEQLLTTPAITASVGALDVVIQAIVACVR